jgi:hypothetical protein
MKKVVSGPQKTAIVTVASPGVARESSKCISNFAQRSDYSAR